MDFPFSCSYKSFYDSMTKEIDDLENMLQIDNNNGNMFMSIQFLEKVLSLTRFCHHQMTDWALTLKLPVGYNWFSDYTKESEKLVKATKDITYCIERMEPYYVGCIAVTEFLDNNHVINQQAVRKMIADITNCKQAAEALEKHNTVFSTNWKHLRQAEAILSETNLQGTLGYDGIIYATRNVSKTLLGILMHGLVYCCPQYKFDSYVYRGEQFFDSSFMVSTDKLQRTVEAEIYKLKKRSGILWYEFWNSKVALDELLKEFERMSEGGEVVDLKSEDRINEIGRNLKQYVTVLKEGSERIIVQIDAFTDAIAEDKKKFN